MFLPALAVAQYVTGPGPTSGAQWLSLKAPPVNGNRRSSVDVLLPVGRDAVGRTGNAL
jgi:hypothetical protein